MKTILVLALLLIGVGANARDVGPCHDDVQKLCGDIKPGKGGMIKCLKGKEDQVSQACKDHMTERKEVMKKNMEEVHAACSADREKLCGDVEPGKGRIMRCMKENRDKLSEECKTQMKEMRGKRKKS